MRFETLKKVLVALDGSDRSFETIKYLTKKPFFRDGAMGICLFGVYEAIPDYYGDLRKEPQFRKSFNYVESWQIQMKRNLRDFLEKSVRELQAAGIEASRIESKLQEKKVGIARDIMAEARKGYGAVVIGRKGAGMMKNLPLGSVAMKLLSGLSDMPLALIGRNISPAEKILLAIDNSEDSMKAVEFVAANLSDKQYKIHLVHVIRDDSDTPAEISEWLANIVAPALSDAKKLLVESGFHEKNVISKILTKQRSRAKAILDEAVNQNISTIIVGRRGLNKVMDFYMGRVSNKIVQMARFNAVWVVT